MDGNQIVRKYEMYSVHTPLARDLNLVVLVYPINLGLRHLHYECHNQARHKSMLYSEMNKMVPSPTGRRDFVAENLFH